MFFQFLGGNDEINSHKIIRTNFKFALMLQKALQDLEVTQLS